MGENSAHNLHPIEKSVQDFLAMLRSLGVNRFEGYGIKVDFGELPSAVTVASVEPAKLVDLGGGLMVSEQDAKDLGLEGTGGQ